MGVHIPFRLEVDVIAMKIFSLLNRGLIIDVSEMHRITVNTEKLTVTIETGANLGTVYKNFGITVLQFLLNLQVQALELLD